MERLRIPVEFNKNKISEVNLYNVLLKHANPSAYIKDVLLGLVPIPGEYIKNKSKEFYDNVDDEDLLDV